MFVRNQMKQTINIIPKADKTNKSQQIELINEFFSIVPNGKPSAPFEFCEVH